MRSREVVETVKRLFKAQAEYDKAAESCEYDRDYFLLEEEKRVNDLEAQLEMQLEELIGSIIEKRLNA